MGREGKFIEQPVSQPVDVFDWKGDEEFEIYPEGARDKSLLISPVKSEYEFLVSNHRYLFKHSFQTQSRVYPDQYWTEIIAYRIGCMLKIPVPPAFVAFNSNTKVCGSLIEWFLNYPNQIEERRVPGGDIMMKLIPSYDRKKGNAHNFETIALYLSILDKKSQFETSWLTFWCDMILFDAIIGNIDRHQDNWGLLWNQDQASRVRMSPVFDNGTSLGYEILEENMDVFYVPDRMRAYIKKGKHHLRWRASDEQKCQHAEMLFLLLNKYPELKEHVKCKLDLFELGQIEAIIEQCTQYPVTVPLSQKRAEFICHLVNSRFLNINEQIKLLL